jgi:anti-sigma B factor antagonist
MVGSDDHPIAYPTTSKERAVNVQVETKDGIVIARVEETQIGADSADEFKSKILEKLPADNGRLAIDLSKVDFMDSSGLGSLVGLLKTVRPGGDMVLFGMRPSVSEILRLTHLDAVFSHASDEAGAVSKLGNAPAASS